VSGGERKKKPGKGRDARVSKKESKRWGKRLGETIKKYTRKKDRGSGAARTSDCSGFSSTPGDGEGISTTERKNTQRKNRHQRREWTINSRGGSFPLVTVRELERNLSGKKKQKREEGEKGQGREKSVVEARGKGGEMGFQNGKPEADFREGKRKQGWWMICIKIKKNHDRKHSVGGKKNSRTCKNPNKKLAGSFHNKQKVKDTLAKGPSETSEELQGVLAKKEGEEKPENGLVASQTPARERGTVQKTGKKNCQDHSSKTQRKMESHRNGRGGEKMIE